MRVVNSVVLYILYLLLVFSLGVLAVCCYLVIACCVHADCVW